MIWSVGQKQTFGWRGVSDLVGEQMQHAVGWKSWDLDPRERCACGKECENIAGQMMRVRHLSGDLV